MINHNKGNGGLLIIGACAVPADPNSHEPSSVEQLGHSIKGLLAKVRRRGRIAGVTVESM